MKAEIVNTDTPIKQKTRTVTRNAFLFAFIAFAVVATITVAGVNSAIRNGRLLANGTVLAVWNGADRSIALETETSARQVEARDKKFVQYVTSVRNTADSGFYLTHAAAHVSESVDERSGFLPLAGDTVEYTYSPEDEYSWVIIAVANPANSGLGSKLSEEIYLAAAGTEHDTVYFRFNAQPGDTTENTIDAEVEFLARNAAGETEMTSSGTQIAYEVTTLDPITEIAMGETDATQVLGDEEFASTTDVIGSVLPTATGDNLIGSTNIWLIGPIVILTASLLLYLPARH